VKILFFILVLFPVGHAALLPSIDGLDAIYGNDERRFVDKKSSPKINELSKSIALIISKDVVEKKILYTQINAKLLSDTDGINLCRDEKFANHHTVNSCTGFLIGEDLLASAGHCFTSASDCDNKLIAFNVQTSNESKSGYSVLNQNIYECSEVVSSAFDADGTQDYAVIRLKKKVKGIKPLKLRRTGAITIDDQVFMIGHPMGLPLIATNKAQINDISNPHFFKATLDSFEGNSGSPVFNNHTFEVEGILVRGEEDFLQDQTRQCYRYQVYDQGTKESPTIKGEGVSRIRDILPFVISNSLNVN
jgi:hypothetical protein